MARKRHRDGAVDPPRKLANRADDTAESSAEFAKPVYLVATQLLDKKTPYSLLMVDAAAPAGGGGQSAPPARDLGAFPGAKSGMSFVAARSKHGSWIVGVGGPRGKTVIYDPSARKKFTGPELCCPKHEPVLISHGGKVYAVSRRPGVSRDATLDFEPWFECLDFNEGVPCEDDDDDTFWDALPPPPFFPGLLEPEEFRSPPEISVKSYAAVGPYILISLEQQDRHGTCAFHVVEKTWEKVSDKSLPFVGQAVALGGSLFAAGSFIPNNAARLVCPVASVFHMSIKASSTPTLPPELVTSLLSIQELPAELSHRKTPQLFFCPLGKDSFCSIRKGVNSRYYAGIPNLPVDMPIILSAFHVEDIDAVLTACQTESSEAEPEDLQVAVQVKQHDQTHKFKARARWLHHMPVVAALSTDSEQPIEFFQEETTQIVKQTGIGRSEDLNWSLYLAVCCRDWSVSQTKAPLYKVDIALSDSDDSSVPLAAPPRRTTLHRADMLESDMGGKTFVSLQSGWIVGIGGNPGGTIILDTKRGRTILGPKLVARKWSPVVAVVGDRIYALTSRPAYLEEPNFAPWFEVLDLSTPDDTETAEGVLSLAEASSWTALPSPLCFPRKLTPTDFRTTPLITVTSSAVVEPYILISVNRPCNCTYAFDTSSGEWHSIEGGHLPFVGAAAPQGGGVFVASAHKYGPIKAYRIRVSTSGKGSAIELCTTVITVRNEEHEEIGAGGARYVPLDREHFALLSWHEDVSGRYWVYDKETDESFPRKLNLKLVTYRIVSSVFQGKAPEIVVSRRREQTFRICGTRGFSHQPIAFALTEK